MLNTHEPISKDDEDWMAILSGQSVPDADPNTVREARVLRMVLLARAEEEKEAEFAKTDDQQWQRLKNQLIAEGYIKRTQWFEVPSISKLFKDLASIIVQTVKPVAELLTWQKLSFAAVYTVLVSVVTLTLFHSADPLQIQSKSVGPDVGQSPPPSRLVLRDLPMLNLQQCVLDLQKKFTDRGTDKKDVVVFKEVAKNESNPQQLIVAIQIAPNPSMDLQNLYETYEIDPEHNRRVYFVCEAHAKVRPE